MVTLCILSSLRTYTLRVADDHREAGTATSTGGRDWKGGQGWKGRKTNRILGFMVVGGMRLRGCAARQQQGVSTWSGGEGEISLGGSLREQHARQNSMGPCGNKSDVSKIELSRNRSVRVLSSSTRPTHHFDSPFQALTKMICILPDARYQVFCPFPRDA